ncbi:biotin--[acetyl-CoA-carboxylase] ligase [Planctomycetota bacterium]
MASHRPGRPDGRVGAEHLTAVGALAVAEAAGEVAGLDAAIRWPNDVTVRGLKLAGVLVERRGSEGSAPCVVGVGLNVNVARDEFPEGLRATATSLAAEAGREFAREDVAAVLLRRLEARYVDACSGRWPDVAVSWRARCSLLGDTIEVESDGQRLRGRVVEADPLTGLELELSDGRRHVCRPDAGSLALARGE